MRFKLLLMRHGATQLNLDRRYIGSLDAPLAEAGKAALHPWPQQHFDHAFISPLKRCRETLAIVFPDLQPEAKILDDWRERDFGPYEGCSYDELKERPAYCRFLETRGLETEPGTETHASFLLRLQRGLEAIAANLKQEDESCLALVHGGVIMGLCALLSQSDPYDWQLKNGEALELLLDVQQAGEQKVFSLLEVRRV